MLHRLTVINSDHDHYHDVTMCNAAEPDNPSFCFLVEINNSLGSRGLFNNQYISQPNIGLVEFRSGW